MHPGPPIGVEPTGSSLFDSILSVSKTGQRDLASALKLFHTQPGANVWCGVV